MLLHIFKEVKMGTLRLCLRALKLLRRLLVGFFSEKTYNTMAFYVFYFGYAIQMYPIERPVLQDIGGLGEVVVLKYKTNPYQTFLRGLGVFGLVSYFFFVILQMIRFFPSEGFTLRVVYIIFYFAVILVCGLVAYVNFDNGPVYLAGWNGTEANTKTCQVSGVPGAVKWKYSPMALLAILLTVLSIIVMGLGMTLLFVVKPNLPAHFFYLLPEQWKSYTTAYLALLIWHMFLVLTGCTAVAYFVMVAFAFVFGTKVIADETAASAELTGDAKIRIFRAMEILNQMANEMVQNLFMPVTSFLTVATGATFTYIALTRFGDPQLGLVVYSMVVLMDMSNVGIVTLTYVQAGKCADASAGLIESIRTGFQESRTLEDPRLQYWRKQLAALRPFEMKIASYAIANVKTTKLLHERIIDYLILLLEL